MSERHRPAIARVFEHRDVRATKAQPKAPPIVLEDLELDINVGELFTARGWRQGLRKALERGGVKVLAINVLTAEKEGVHVVVTVKRANKPPRQKPVTRGGAPITGPRRVRTMAAKRREAARNG